MGYSYADVATAKLIQDTLAPKLIGDDAMATGAAWRKMADLIRNLGRPGISSMAIAAVDNALWDLKGKLLNVSVAALLGLVRPRIMAYGSGGFTSYSESQLREQLAGWAESGLLAVKMKIGRMRLPTLIVFVLARQAIGPNVKLFVNANGAYTRKQALAQAHRFRQEDAMAATMLEGTSMSYSAKTAMPSPDPAALNHPFLRLTSLILTFMVAHSIDEPISVSGCRE